MKETMRKVGGIYGAENSAHHFFRDFSYCDSGMIPWLIVAQIISETNESLYELVSDLEKYRMWAGALDVQGPGILVTIKDPVMDQYQEDYSVITNNFDLLLGLVNRLKEAGAEAISINEQRISANTEISLAGSNININGTATAPPYIVKAIGNPQTLEGAITLRGGIVYTMKMKYNLVVDTEIKENMVIGRYTGVVAFRYAKPVDTETQAVVQP